MLCAMATVALNGAKTYYEEKHDKATFVKNIISDNILLGTSMSGPRSCILSPEEPRAVFLIRQVEPADPCLPLMWCSTLFPDKQVDFVLSISETDVALIKQLCEGRSQGALQDRQADRGDDHRGAPCEGGHRHRHHRGPHPGVGGPTRRPGWPSTWGQVFDTEKSIINYENLGIGRLIYQLPTTLCEMFLQEVFKKNPIDALDQETLFTINKFFENNLNVSETARKLFVHRNTLVYRLRRSRSLPDWICGSLTTPSPSRWR